MPSSLFRASVNALRDRSRAVAAFAGVGVGSGSARAGLAGGGDGDMPLTHGWSSLMASLAPESLSDARRLLFWVAACVLLLVLGEFTACTGDEGAKN